MTPATRRLQRLLWAALFGVACAGLVAGCGEEGVTPDCPQVPLYNVREPDVLEDPDIQQARSEAIDAGCLTEVGEAAAPQG